MLPNFIEALLRISVIVAQKRDHRVQPLSVTFDNFVISVVKRDCATLEGFALKDQIQVPEVQEVLDHYKPKLMELYDKMKIAEWSSFDITHYSSFGRLTFKGT